MSLMTSPSFPDEAKRSNVRVYNFSAGPAVLPEEVLRKAVKGMLPRNRLARQQITKLKIYAGPEHPHGPQDPKPLKWDDA